MKAAPLLLVVALAACTSVEPQISPGKPCEIDAAAGVAPPESVLEVRTGMSMHDIIELVDSPGYAPTKGQYYFDGTSKEGDCEIEGSGGYKKPCTLVVEFRARIEGRRDMRLTDQIQGCWWGGIGE